jgi:hypothetical protein
MLSGALRGLDYPGTGYAVSMPTGQTRRLIGPRNASARRYASLRVTPALRGGQYRRLAAGRIARGVLAYWRPASAEARRQVCLFIWLI